jgi:hypothetical protein
MSQANSQQPRRGLLGYDPTLEEEIFAFQRASYPHRREDWIAPRWKWMFLDSAARLDTQPMVWLYRGRDGIAGHQGAIAVRLKALDHELITGWFVETMVSEAYRGKAVGPMVVKKALEDLPFNLSLGQTDWMRKLQFALGWEQVAGLGTYVYLLDPAAILRDKLSNGVLRSGAGLLLATAQRMKRILGHRRIGFVPEVRRLEDFGAEHDALWQRVKPQYRCAVVRDASYLNWKYVEQPGQDFTRLEIRRQGEVVAVAVLMMREPDESYAYARGFVVDLVLSLEDRAVIRATLEAIRAEFQRLEAAMVVFDLISVPLVKEIQTFGFVARAPSRYLLIAEGEAAPEVAQTVRDPACWFVTRGDSDIDRPW